MTPDSALLFWGHPVYSKFGNIPNFLNVYNFKETALVRDNTFGEKGSI